MLGVLISIVTFSRSSLEVLLQQSIFRMHVRSKTPFSKAPQMWGVQLGSWKRNLIWRCLSRSTFMQLGKLSWYWYSSIGKTWWSTRLVTRMWAKSSTSVKSFWCSLVYPVDFCNTIDLGPGLFADLTNSTSLAKGPRGQEAEPSAPGFDLIMGRVLPGRRGGSAQESRAYWRQFLMSF